MTSNKCPNCSLVNFAGAPQCARCGAELAASPEQIETNPEPFLQDFSRPANELAVSASAAQNKAGVFEAIIGILWLLFLPYLGFLFIGLSGAIASANGAPQEAAAGAMTAAYAIIPYCALRGLTSAARLFQGK